MTAEVSPVERPSQPPPVGVNKILLLYPGGANIDMKLDTEAEILYTISEVAALLKVNKNTVYQLINKGYLKWIKTLYRAYVVEILSWYCVFGEKYRDEARHGKAFEGLLKRYFG